MTPLDKHNVADMLALTPVQEGMLLQYLKDPGGDSYFEQLCLEVEARWDIALVRETWNRLVEANEMLRTVYRWEEVKNPAQIILKQHPVNLLFHDVSAGPDPERRIEALKQEDRQRKFDLREVPFRVTVAKGAADRWFLIISHHHILYDGWSNGILLKEFFQTYTSLAGGRPPEFPPKNTFKAFIKWQQKQDKAKEKAFWQAYLADYQAVRIPVFTQHTESQPSAAVQTIEFSLPAALTREIGQCVRKQKITLATLVYTAWGIVLQRYCDADDVVLGTTVSGRTPQVPDSATVVGLWINTLPLRINPPADRKAEELLQDVQSALQAREEYQSTSLVAINQYAAHPEDLFDSIVVIENYPLAEAITQTPGIRVKSYASFEQTPYPLTLAVTAFTDTVISLAYQERRYSSATAERMAAHFVNVLTELIRKPGERVAVLEMLSPGEREEMLRGLNRTEAPYPAGQTLHGLFEQQVQRTPQHAAVFYGGQSLTYRELNRKANGLANALRDLGVQPDTFVGVCTGRSLEMVISILAVLKSGAAYVPIDPAAPVARMQYLLADSEAKWLITGQSMQEKVREIALPLHILTAEAYSREAGTDENPAPVNQDHHLAYLMYTSGTTGQPKGVMIEHRNVTNYITWFGRTIPVREQTHYLMLIDYIFDPSVADLFSTLLHGATLFIAGQDLIYDQDRFARYIEDHQIHVIDSVPAILKELLAQLPKLPSLHTILVGSEALDNTLKDQMIRKGYTLFNHYGLTETTVDVSVQKCSAEPVTIGKPVANVTCYVLDGHQRLVPRGMPGELFVGGAGVGRGYLKQPGLQAEKFLVNPYAGGRMYRTGDLVRWLPDGNLAFLGRVDHQINLRGFRVEPDEIQAVLERMPDVKEAAILDKPDQNGQTQLVAFYVAGRPLAAAGLRAFLAQHLPAYMIPAYFVALVKIPRTAAGKKDRKALLSLAETNPDAQRTHVAPQTDLEKTLAALWKEMLNRDKVGLDENFFDIGGNSLYIIRLNSRVKSALNRDIPVTAFFEFPTIRSFAAFLSQKEDPQDSSAALENRLEKSQGKLKQRRELLKSKI